MDREDPREAGLGVRAAGLLVRRYRRRDRIPGSWRLLYENGNDWKPVDAAREHGVPRDAYNTVHFKPVTAAALWLELVMQPNVAAGVEDWDVQ